MRLNGQPNPAIKTKILHIGLALVMLPCFIDIICLWALYDLTNRSERLAEEEHHINEVVRHANTVLILYSTTTAKLINAMTAQSQYRERSMNDAMIFIGKLRQEFLDYETSTADDEVMHAQVLEMRTMTNREINNLLNYTTANKDASVMEAYTVLGPGVRKLVKEASDDSDKIIRMIEGEKMQLAQKSAEQKQSRWLIKDIVLLGIAANTIFAIAFALVFFRWMTNRLRVLVDNAQRLPKMQPLNEHVTGSDELSYLDTVLHEASAELRNALEQRQYLMDMVAHDIRSPLMSSQVALEILSDPRIGDLPVKVKRQIDALSRNTKRLTALTTDLLTVDKLEAGKLDVHPAELDAKEAVQESIDSLYELAKKKNVELVNECEATLIYADRIRLGQVLTNLISNAIKFSPENVDVTVRSSKDRETVTLLVIDKGPGIELLEQEKVFEKYAQLENGTGKGFGLGLAICKLIVEAHGGTINVKSKAGQGCTFWFRLPDKKGGASAQGDEDVDPTAAQMGTGASQDAAAAGAETGGAETGGAENASSGPSPAVQSSAP
ncbi:MAG: HAMP domain-containing histidine kinase [Cyanobacteria bacterium SZAS-4]|nr:HAMP domain-containing histidine kinase [Cyanobacteria bacterium SZAS-4]